MTPFGEMGTPIIDPILSRVKTSSLSTKEMVKEQEFAITSVLEKDAYMFLTIEGKTLFP